MLAGVSAAFFAKTTDFAAQPDPHRVAACATWRNTLPIRPFLPPTDQIPSSDLMSSLTRDVIRRDRARDELFAIIGKMPLKSLLGFSRSRNFPIP